MKILISVLLFTATISTHAQKILDNHLSQVDSTTRNRIINQLKIHTNQSLMPKLYDEINDSTKILRVISLAIVVKDKDSVDFKLDFESHIRFFSSAKDFYVLYNFRKDGRFKIIGTFQESSTSSPQLYPVESTSAEANNFLDEISKYYNVNEVNLVSVAGVAGTCVMVDGAIWIVDKNIRTDLKTYVKEHYWLLGDYRAQFLFQDDIFNLMNK